MNIYFFDSTYIKISFILVELRDPLYFNLILSSVGRTNTGSNEYIQQAPLFLY